LEGGKKRGGLKPAGGEVTDIDHDDTDDYGKKKHTGK
jgi:hypothetical protein